MTKPKIRDKKYNPNKQPRGVVYHETSFLYSLEDSTILQFQTYHRLACLASPQGGYADRTTLMIRMYAALEMMQWFISDRAEDVLRAALDILVNCRDKERRCIKSFSDKEYTLLAMALSIAHELFDGCSLWEEAIAVKVGEDKCIQGAVDFDYIFAGKVD